MTHSVVFFLELGFHIVFFFFDHVETIEHDINFFCNLKFIKSVSLNFFLSSDWFSVIQFEIYIIFFRGEGAKN